LNIKGVYKKVKQGSASISRKSGHSNSEVPSSTTSDVEESEPPDDDDLPPQPGSNRAQFFPFVSDENWNNWKWQFQNRITTIQEFAGYIPLSTEGLHNLEKVAHRYPLSITPYFLSLINPNDVNDPIRKQSLPSILEIDDSLQGYDDPLDEHGDSVVPGLIHRYADRALMVTTNICPMLCRHCTRKRDWKEKGTVRSKKEFQAMFDYIREHKSIRDVIISGGDPLSLSTARLEDIISALRNIEHVEIIRIGSRYPVVLPQRVDNELCEMLSKYGPIWFNTHFNSVREITPESAAACDLLLRHGIPVNNQSVLLKGINDSVEEQLSLCQGLLKIKVRPYYLFQCDEVRGAEHLRTSIEKGVEIIAGMRGHTSGMGIPTFVVDLPNGGGKVPLLPNYVVAVNNGSFLFKNYNNNLYSYRDPSNKETESSVNFSTIDSHFLYNQMARTEA
jgi:lysine 2,3-aminomutase